MDIRQLTYFVSTYEHNSFSAAAKECCVTVQTISKAISNLEQDLNNELLFVRKNNGVIPTEFGRAFYPKAKQRRNTTTFARIQRAKSGCH